MDNNLVNGLRVKDIYFKSFKFNQLRGVNGNIKLDIKHKFELAKSNDRKNVKMTIKTLITTSDMRLDLDIETVGVFEVDDNENMNENYPQFMVNTLYPFLRSQIQLMTTQPGLLPIMLPIGTPLINKEPILKLESDDSIKA